MLEKTQTPGTIYPKTVSIPQSVNGLEQTGMLAFIGMNADGTYNQSGGVVEVAYNTPNKVYVYAYGKIAYDQMRLGSQLYTIDINKNAYFGVPAVSETEFYEINGQFMHKGGSRWEFGTFNLLNGVFSSFRPDPFGVSISNSGELVDSHVATSGNALMYGTLRPPTPPEPPPVIPPVVTPLPGPSPVIEPPAVITDAHLKLAGVEQPSALSLLLDEASEATSSQPGTRASATVHLANILDVGHEVLSLSSNGALFPNILAASSSDGTLTIKANEKATLAEWQAALRSVTYQNTEATPTTGVRTVTFDFNNDREPTIASNPDFVVVMGNGPAQQLRTLLSPTDANLQNLMLAFDTGAGQNAGSAFRLYGIFGRAPDDEGLGYWIQSLDNGATLKDVAQEFVLSEEFGHAFGSQATDAQFVDGLYEHFFDRSPDASGQSYWLDGLNSGLSRADVLVGFSESTEYVALTAPVLNSGLTFWELPPLPAMGG